MILTGWFVESYDVSVVIVNWNTRNILCDCLRSVYEQTRDVTFEVIVIDNASSDDSVTMVKAEYPQVILIENRDNRGFAAANNQGMAIARGRYILLLNSDTVILDGAIQKTLAFAGQHPKAAVVGCRVLNQDQTLQPTCFMFPSILNLLLSTTYLYKLFPHSHFFGREQMSWWARNEVREVQVVTGCFMLVQRLAIDKVGPMDEGFFLYDG
jgi:GT2 family glycosyltransferase